ncbi:MAG: stalk domain-containing protein, partial [Oscillospiraceae bacterium]
NGAASDTIAEEKLNLRNELEKHCSEVVAKRIDEKVDSLSKRDKAAHAELISMLTDCQSSLNESINELNSTAGSSSDSITQKKANSLSEELVDAALNGNLGAIVKAADRLEVLNAIINGDAVDPEKAAEMSKELFEDALAGIEEDVGSVLNRTNDYYSEDNKQSAAEVAGKLEIAINEAKGFAQSAAAYSTNSTSSEEFNSMKAESLNKLGELLEALSSQDGTSGSQSSSDPLYKAFMETLADNADEILSDAANAAALADSELSSDKQNIDNLKAQIDSAYEKYIEALADGDGENAEKYSEKLSELTDALSDARRESAEKIKDSIGGLLADKSNALDPNADKKKAEDDARIKLAEINALKDLQSDTDAALIEQLCDALESFDNAAESGNLSDTEDAYNDLKDSLANLPDVFLDNEDKAAAVAYAAEKLDDCGIDALNDQLKEDVTAALDGTLSPTQGGINGADSGTEGPQDSGFLPSTLDELTQYMLVIPEFDIYSNDMSVEQDGVVFVSAERLAEAAGAQFIRAEDVIVIKDENVLIEFKAEDSTAYINDKMFALAKAPFLLNGETYIPVELITAGYGLSEVQEENTTILR